MSISSGWLNVLSACTGFSNSEHVNNNYINIDTNNNKTHKNDNNDDTHNNKNTEYLPSWFLDSCNRN